MLLRPSDFFEKKKIQEQLQSEVVNPEEEIGQGIKRLKSPSDLFNPPQLVEKIIEEEIVDEDIDIDIEVDPIEEIKNLVEEVRSQIPNIPEIKYYDEELIFIRQELDKVFNSVEKKSEPKYYDEDINLLEKKIDLIHVKYYDEDIKELHQKIDGIEIPEVPEVKYYDEDIKELHQKIDGIEIPEIKYYDAEVYNLGEEISALENKVRTLPEVKYYDEDIKELHQKIDGIEIPEVPEIKYYDEDIKELNTKINEIQIPEVKYYEQDIKELHQKIDGIEIPEVPEVKYYDEDIKELHQKIDGIEIPSVKYYDKDISDLKINLGLIKSSIKEPKFYDEDIKELRKIIREIKQKQETIVVLSEGLLDEPPETDSKDPLTPTNQNFATLEDLSNHYRLFINRIQHQLSTLGGGGETRLEFLDDVDRTSIKTNGYYLKYDEVSGKFIGAAVTSAGGSQTLEETLGFGNTSSFGMSVGVVTATSFDLGSGRISDKTISTNSLSEESIDSFSILEYRSATYEIQITRGSSYHITTLKILHDGLNVYLTEYGTIKTSTSLASFSSDISGNFVRILSTTSSNAETNFKIIKTLIKI